MSRFNNKTIVGPHNHVSGSLDSGNSTQDFIKSAAKDFGRNAIAITDHGMMSALLEAHDFSKDLKKKENINITIIPGIEIYLQPDYDDPSLIPNDKGTIKAEYYHLTMHFSDFSSYLDGSKISKTSYDRSIWKGGELKPLWTWDELRSMSGKVTLTSGCMISPVGKNFMNNRKEVSERYFKRLKEIAGPGKFFAEVLPYEVSKNWNGKTKTFDPIPPTECCPSGKLQVDVNKWIFHLAKKYNVPVIISEDAHYAKEEDKVLQDFRINKDGKGSWKMSDANCLHSTEWIYEEMLRLHPEETSEVIFEKWIDNSYDMLGNFKGFEPKFEFRLPKIVVDKSITNPNGISYVEKKELSTDDELLEYTMELVKSKNIINLDDEIYFERLMKEIDALYYNGHTNLARYMLFLNKVFDWCKKNNVLTGPGRGSSGGSLLAYALGITAIDPIVENLSFERFFDKTRIQEGLADIDSDFSDRSKVVDMLKSEYGDSFAYLGISSTFKTKSILKDVDRYLYGEVRKETEMICKLIPHSGQGLNELDFLNGFTDADGIYHEGFIDSNAGFKAYLEHNPQHYDYLMKMTKLPRQSGRHAAGILIADIPVQDFIPMMKVSDEPTTQLLPKWVEKSGGVKYDILGLSTLEDIRVALNLIKTRHKYDIDPWKVPDEKAVWDSIVEDPTTIFQLHTETVRPGLRSMKPKTVQEAAILTSVFRPGAMDAPSEEAGMTMADMFLFRWNNRQYVKYIHEDLKPILESTVGVVVFQEQSMRIVNELGGLTMPETNQFRKAISKKSGDILLKLLQKVKENLLNKDWSEDQVNALVDQLKASGKYAFNMSHATAYSYIARACGFLKLYFPVEWWTAVLSNASKDDLIKLWPRVCNVVKMPDINLSTDQFQIVKDGEAEKILAPINFINGVGTSAISQILEFRPFTSIRDILERTTLNRGVMFKLILSGTLDRFFKDGMNDIEKMQEYLNIRAEVLGKKSPETVPEEYRNLTPIKEYLLMKSVYKVYFDDLEQIATPFLINRGVLHTHTNGVTTFNGNNIGEKVHIDAQYLQKSLEENEYIDGTVVGFISSMEEKAYDNKKKKMMIMTVEIGDKAYEMIKFPDWGKDNHGLDKSIEDGICLFVIYKKPDEGAPIVVKHLLPIENINFLKDAAEERKEKEKNEKAQRKISKSKGTGIKRS